MAKGKAASPNGHPKLTSVTDWRKPREEGELVPLPSGNWVRIRPADVFKMIQSGVIPDFLSSVALKATWTEQNPAEIGESFELAEKYDKLMEVIIPAIFAYPKVAVAGHEPAEDEITIDDIDLADRTAAFNLALSGVGVMRQFRKQQIESMEPTHDGEGVRAEAEPDGGDS